MPPAKPKPQLHQSHLTTLSRCGEQFKRIFLDGDKEAPGFLAVVGHSSHEVARLNLSRKIEQKELMPLEEVRDCARDSFVRAWQSTPVILTKDERESGLEKVKGAGIDRTIALSLAHATQIAPYVNPKSVERKWVVEAKGYPYNLSGQFDLEEVDETLRDYKTGAKLVTQHIADTSLQLTIYAWAKWIIDKIMPPKVVLDGAAVSDAGTVRFGTFESTRTAEDFHVARRRFDRAVEVIEKGAFQPANPADWWCSVKFCGFAADGSCPFFNRERALHFSMNQQPKKGGSSYGRKQTKVVDARTEQWWEAVR